MSLVCPISMPDGKRAGLFRINLIIGRRFVEVESGASLGAIGLADPRTKRALPLGNGCSGTDGLFACPALRQPGDHRLPAG